MYTRSVEFDTATASLAADGWCVLRGLMSRAQTRALTNECVAMHDAQQLTPARVGADRDHTRLRGDSTHWFESDALSAPQQAFADRIDVLRIELSRSLMLGLVDSESHYAVYQPGAGYARHLDQLRNNDARVVSAVFYLNDAWRAAPRARTVPTRTAAMCRREDRCPDATDRQGAVAAHRPRLPATHR